MECAECGAMLPGDETCQDRFHALLAAEVRNPELLHVHGLTVLTYHLQHPSLTKPWYQAACRSVSISPGAAALTRMPSPATSRASPMVKLLMAPLLAA